MDEELLRSVVGEHERELRGFFGAMFGPCRDQLAEVLADGLHVAREEDGALPEGSIVLLYEMVEYMEVLVLGTREERRQGFGVARLVACGMTAFERLLTCAEQMTLPEGVRLPERVVIEALRSLLEARLRKDSGIDITDVMRTTD